MDGGRIAGSVFRLSAAARRPTVAAPCGLMVARPCGNQAASANSLAFILLIRCTVPLPALSSTTVFEDALPDAQMRPRPCLTPSGESTASMLAARAVPYRVYHTHRR